MWQHSRETFFRCVLSWGALFYFGRIIMIITFCGHSNYVGSEEDKVKILSILEEIAGNTPTELYLGGYGGFDCFARNCGEIYQTTHPSVRLLLITPYITLEHQKNHLKYDSELYDEIIYPPLERYPKRFAISHRNRWMVERADYLICYVTHSFGGAYQTYSYAARKRKPIYNISLKDI